MITARNEGAPAVRDACKATPRRPMGWSDGSGWIELKLGHTGWHACSYDCARALLQRAEADPDTGRWFERSMRRASAIASEAFKGQTTVQAAAPAD